MNAAGTSARKFADRPWLAALAWLVFLTPFFFLSYGFANWLTSLRPNLPEIAFAWERGIPFLAWTIVPYWSTDLLYAVSLFLCVTRPELNTLGKRLLATQLICIGGFLLFPLQFTWPHPHAAGISGALFDALTSFDRPYNQAPSLHVALTAVLWAAYSRHMRRWPLALLRAWLVLSAVSTLTTYQHHFIDLPTGLLAGFVAIAMFPYERPGVALPKFQDPLRFGFGALYSGIALVFVLAARFGEASSVILLWPGISFAIAAAAYWTGRPEVFRKSNGRIPVSFRLLLAHYQLMAWLNSRLRTRTIDRANEIADGVWLGRIPGEDRVKFASFVDMTAEFSFNPEGRPYRGIPSLDVLAPDSERLTLAAGAIREFHSVRPTLVFCALGYSRSAAAAIAWLVATDQAPTVDAAIQFVHSRRRWIVIRQAYRDALERWAAGRKSGV